MKKSIVSLLLSVSLLLTLAVCQAVSVDLEGAIIKLWTSGPSGEIEQTLQAAASSADKAIADRAGFHLSCLKILRGDEKSPEILAELEAKASTDSEKSAIATLKKTFEERLNKLPSSFQKKVSLDFKDTDIKALVQIIAQQSQTNVVLHASVKKLVTIRLIDATIEQALDSICAISDLRYENRNGVFVLLPIKKDQENYSRMTYQLKSMSPEKAFSLLNAQRTTQAAPNAPENFKNGQPQPPAAPALPSGVTIKNEENLLVFEGKPESVEKYLTLISNLDQEIKAHKISFRIWELNSEAGTDLKAFSEMSDKERAEKAKIVSAPQIIALPRQPATIEVQSSGKDNATEEKDYLEYKLKSFFNETEDENQLRINLEISVTGSSTLNGNHTKIKKNHSSTLQVARNKWIMLPLYEGATRYFLEFQINPHSS
ncbi:MAG: hypothetical protein ACOYXC_11285 [Candidatus Rifleibacteriota bacterium]